MHGVKDGYVICAELVDDVGVAIGPELLEIPSDNSAVELWY